MLLKADEWALVRFEKSKKKDKKVQAILKNKKTGAVKILPFGQAGSSTYHNLTKIGNDPIHQDLKRREAYRRRHYGEGSASRKWSPGYLSWWYLW